MFPAVRERVRRRIVSDLDAVRGYEAGSQPLSADAHERLEGHTHQEHPAPLKGDNAWYSIGIARNPARRVRGTVTPRRKTLHDQGDTMDLLILAHLSSSYEKWKAVFDADADAQSAWISGEVLVAQANEKTAMIVAYGVDMEGMAAFMGTPEFAERTAEHVDGHTVYSISELPPPA